MRWVFLNAKTKDIPVKELEFLMVETPQDTIQLVKSMERDRSPNLADDWNLLTSLNR